MGAMGANSQERVLILGASGFIGRHVLSQFSEAVIPPTGWRLSDLESARVWLEDMQPSVIVNCTGLLRGDEPSLLQINQIDPIKFIDLLATVLPQTVYVHFGSAAEYGPQRLMPVTEDAECNPTWSYGRAKLAASTHALAEPRLRSIVVRPSNVIGPGLQGPMLISMIIDQLKSGASHLNISRRGAIRDYIDVREVAQAVRSLVTTPNLSGIFNLSSGIGVSNEEVSEMIRDVTQLNFTVEYGEVRNHSNEVDAFIAANDKLFAATGFRPSISFEESLRDAWRPT